MATILKIAASRRTNLGTAACRRLRRAGNIPANVYGHGEDPISISLKADDLRPVLSSGAHIVDLDLEGQSATALIREVQWDTYSTYVRHMDFVRVDANERVRLTVPVHLKGTAVGVLGGGILEQPLHAVHIECPAIEIPDFLTVRISHLEIGGAVHVRELTDVPENVKILEAPDAVVVHVVKPGVEEVPTTEEAVGGPTEPELIKRETKSEDEDE